MLVLQAQPRHFVRGDIPPGFHSRRRGVFRVSAAKYRNLGLIRPSIRSSMANLEQGMHVAGSASAVSPVVSTTTTPHDSNHQSHSLRVETWFALYQHTAIGSKDAQHIPQYQAPLWSATLMYTSIESILAMLKCSFNVTLSSAEPALDKS